MKILKWLGIALATLSVCGAAYGTATDATVPREAWGLAGDEQSAEDIPIRDESGQFTATNLMDLISGMMDGTETFGDLVVSGTLTTGTTTTTDTAITAVSLTVSGSTALDGGLTMDTDKFTVDDGSGNTLIDGTLSIGGAISDPTDDVDIDDSCTISGAAALSSTLDVAGAADFAGTTEFADNTCTITDATGAIKTDSTLYVAGASTLVGNVAVTGTTTVTDESTFNDHINLGAGADLVGSSTSDIDIDSVFTVAGATGNTAVVGTLTVTGAQASAAHITLGAGADLVGSSTSDINMDAFDVAGATGNTTVGGTLGVTGITTFTGAVTANGGVTLGAGDDLIGGATSDITMHTDKFTVAGASGNTVVGGTLAVTGVTTFTAGVTANGGVTLGAGDDLIGGTTSDITMNTNKFTVAGATGNTVVAGTLTQTGIATFAATSVFTGGQTRKERFYPADINLDDTNPPTKNTTEGGTANVWECLQFDADAGSTGDDIVHIKWRVPDGYKADSGRMNIIWSCESAEVALDTATFDLSYRAVAIGEAVDGAMTEITAVEDELWAGTADLTMVTQLDFETAAIAVDDTVYFTVWVDETLSAFTDTVDIHLIEIEWESTE